MHAKFLLVLNDNYYNYIKLSEATSEVMAGSWPCSYTAVGWPLLRPNDIIVILVYCKEIVKGDAIAWMDTQNNNFHKTP